MFQLLIRPFQAALQLHEEQPNPAQRHGDREQGAQPRVGGSQALCQWRPVRHDVNGHHPAH